jgi:enterochelin esterase-like enzyme
VVAALAGLLVGWNRLPGPLPVRVVARAVMAMACQATAVLTVLVWVNNTYGLYDSWADLLGGGNGQVRLATGRADLHQDGGAVTADVRRVRFTPLQNGVLRTTVTGPRSHITGEIDVWLPPQYYEPAYRRTAFPVVELLPGYPGTPRAWFGAMGAQRELSALIRANEVRPMILVAPKMNVLGPVDPGCADLPHGSRTSTWLGVDAPELVKQNFRVAPDAAHWAVMGYSAGAYCAVNLVLHHPRTLHAAVSLSGYNAPVARLVTRHPALARANNPYLELRDARRQPDIALLMAGSEQDGDTVYAARSLLGELRHPGASRLLTVTRGGHNTRVWRAMLPTALRWIAGQMPQTVP